MGELQIRWATLDHARGVAGGWDAAYLWVLRGNDRATRFYEHHGWHPDGGEKVGSAGGEHRLHEVRHFRRLRLAEA